MKHFFQFLFLWLIWALGGNKNYILIFLFLLHGICQAQFSAGIGAGLSDKGKLVQLSLNHNTKLLGIDCGFLAHADNRNPVYFTGQLFKSIYISDDIKFSPSMGAAYKIGIDYEE